MNVKDLRSFHQKRPFRPITIYLSDGRTLEVEHVDYLFFPPKGNFFIVVDAKEDPDQYLHHIAYSQVTEIKMKPNE